MMADTHRILEWIKSAESSIASPNCIEPVAESHARSDDDNDSIAQTQARRPLKRLRNESPNTNDSFLYPYHTQRPLEPRTTPMADQATPTRRGKRLNDDDQTPTQPARRQRSELRDKKKSSLLRLETPVYIKTWNFEEFSRLPGFQDVQHLYESIVINEAHHGVVPGEVCNMFTLYAETSGRKVFPHYFRTPDPLPVVDSYGFTACDRAKIELALLRDVQREASLSKLYKRHECGWVSNVYTPLLRHISKQGVGFETVMTATMEGDSIPLIRTPGTEAGQIGSLSDFCVTVSASSGTSMSSAAPAYHSRSNAKIVDYVLTLDSPCDSTLYKTIRKSIEEAHLRGDNHPHVNQTAYLAIQDTIIAVSIEVKSEFSAADPLMQLGVWIAAWHKRMWSLRRQLFATNKVAGIQDEQLLSQIREKERHKRLVTVPLIAIVGHQWNMYFACFDATCITLHGPIEMGNTESLLKVYSLVASLQAVAEWVRTVFKAAMEDWFMCEDQVAGDA